MKVVGLQAVLRELLNPRQWKPQDDRRFFLDGEQVAALADAAEALFRAEPSVLRLHGEGSSPPLLRVIVGNHRQWTDNAARQSPRKLLSVSLISHDQVLFVPHSYVLLLGMHPMYGSGSQ